MDPPEKLCHHFAKGGRQNIASEVFETFLSWEYTLKERIITPSGRNFPLMVATSEEGGKYFHVKSFLTLKMPRNLHLKMLSVYVVC